MPGPTVTTRVSRAVSHTICTHGGSQAVLASSRIFRRFSDSWQLLEEGPQQTGCKVIGDFTLLIALAGQGIDPLGPTAGQIVTFLYYLFDTDGPSPQTIKGFRTCLASVLSRRGKAAAVQAKTISDIASMELRRPRITSVLPQ